MAVAELQLQVLALDVRAIADAGDEQLLGEALGHAGDEVLHQRPLHAPEGAGALRIVGRLHRDAAVLHRIGDVVGGEVLAEVF